MKKEIVFALASVLILSTSAFSDNFRCPNGNIVSTGDRLVIVATKCDPPTGKSSRMQSEAGQQGATILNNIEEWVYNEGTHRLVHILTFRNGVLESVSTEGYGQ